MQCVEQREVAALMNITTGTKLSQVVRIHGEPPRVIDYSGTWRWFGKPRPLPKSSERVAVYPVVTSIVLVCLDDRDRVTGTVVVDSD
jgi:hypothetical protein